jgi:hypothetical protein
MSHLIAVAPLILEGLAVAQPTLAGLPLPNVEWAWHGWSQMILYGAVSLGLLLFRTFAGGPSMYVTESAAIHPQWRQLCHRRSS